MLLPSWFVIRLPHQPITSLLTAWQLASDGTPDGLRSLLTPAFWRTLWLASPDLADTLNTQPANVPFAEHTVATLWKYVIRHHYRATPYGLFAGVGVGRVGEQTQVRFGQSPWQVTLRPDNAYLRALARSLKVRFADALSLRLNNTLYAIGQEYRFSERQERRQSSVVDLVGLQHSSLLAKVVDQFDQASTRRFEEVAATLSETEDGTDLIQELIDVQFLSTSLDLPITGKPVFDALLDVLATIPAAASIHEQFQFMHQRLQAFTVTDSPRPLGRQWQDLVHQQTDLPPTPPLQADLFFHPEQVQLPKPVVTTILQELAQLQALRSPVEQAALDTFKHRFQARFQEQFVPLLLALDPEFGVGYSNQTTNTFLADLPLPPPITERKTDRLDGLRQRVYSRCLLTGQSVVQLSDTDLEAAQLTALPPTSALSEYVLGTYVLNPTNAESMGDFFVKWVGGPSAVSLLGRFCHGHEELTALARSLVDWEQQQHSDRLLAEICYLPGDRSGNIASRPALRHYEIPCLTPSGVDEAHTIPLSDLWVTLGPTGQVELWSARQQCFVAPRLGNAHRSDISEEVYRFLTDVGGQDLQQLLWTWGTLKHQPFLPRVVYKHIILERAQWVLQRAVFGPSLPTTIAELRQAYKLPRYVVLVDADNELLFDLDVPEVASLLWDEFLKRDYVLLNEWLETPDRCWVSDGSDRYTAEVFFPWLHPKAKVVPVPKPPTTLTQQAHRHPPGSGWFYLKLYSAPSATDRLLVELLDPLTQAIQQAGLGDDFFFIRYADPDYHLRLRIHSEPGQVDRLLAITQAHLDAYVNRDLVHKFTLDTYEPEYDRYEPALMTIAERYFALDSKAILAWLTIMSDGTIDDRIRYALQHADALLTNFSLSLAEKGELALHLQESYWQEYGRLRETRDYMNTYYRQLAIDTLLQETPVPSLTTYVEAAQPIGNQIGQYLRQAGNPDRLFDVIASHLHMAMNRLFPVPGRTYELIVYHCLARLYRSALARQKPGHRA